MLKFTDSESGGPVWINPRQVSALTPPTQAPGDGCVLLLAGGFEIRVREDAAEVSAQVQKRLDAY